MPHLFTPRLSALLAALVVSVSAFTATIAFDALRGQTGHGPNGGNEYCGNSVVDAGEQCDHGSSNGKDGECTSGCMWETGGSGGGGEGNRCGDGIVDEGEACDTGLDNGKAQSNCATCCIPKPSGAAQILPCLCGNGLMEWPELCDEGYRNGRGSSTCNRFCGPADAPGSVCGNGKQEGSEECDDGNGSDEDRCTVKCKKAVCGDGIKQPYGKDGMEGTSDDEECDLASGNGGERSSCTRECRNSGGSDDDDSDGSGGQPFCGNGKKEGKEECDDGNLSNGDGCTNICLKPRCGDGIPLNLGEEQCDDGNTEDMDACSNSCRKGYCGDHIVQKPLKEECDEGSDANGAVGSKCSRSCTWVSNKSGGGNAEQEAKRKQEENKRIEELRRKREAAEKALEESKQGQNSEGGPSEEGKKSGLLCFDSEGTLTDERSRCDSDQSKFVRGGDQNVSEQKAKEEIRKEFLGMDVEERRRAELLESMKDAERRISVLLRNTNRHPEILTYLEQSADWLDRGIAYFSEAPRSLDEVQQMVVPVKQLLAQITGLIQQDKQIPEEKVDINPIVKKVETLLLKFRESFIALAQAGVELDQDALEAYVDSVELFNETANTCAKDELECSKLMDVLNLLKPASEPLLKALDEHPDVMKQIEAKFDQDS